MTDMSNDGSSQKQPEKQAPAMSRVSPRFRSHPQCASYCAHDWLGAETEEPVRLVQRELGYAHGHAAVDDQIFASNEVILHQVENRASDILWFALAM
jgi:hypothetical protein